MSRSVPGSATWRGLRLRALMVASLVVALFASAPAAHAERSTLSSGDRQTCVVRSDRGVSCWGSYRLSTLSEADRYSKPVPTDVPGAGPALAVATGRLGYQCALRTDATVGCWGAGRYLDTDLGITFEVPSVQLVVNSAEAPIAAYVDVAVNDREGCAVRASGAVDCWRPDGIAYAISGITDATSITGIGTGAFCARRSTGGVACWDRGFARVPDPVERPTAWTNGAIATEVPGITDALTVSGLCALRQLGTVSCWTISHRPQFGDESLTFTAPVEFPGVTEVSDIAVGAGHKCFLFQWTAVACDGDNRDGQFSAALSIPAGLGGPGGSDVSVTGSSTCVRLIDATVRCTGNSRRLNDGILGNPSRPSGVSIRPIGDFTVAESTDFRPEPFGDFPIKKPGAPISVAPAPFGDVTPTSLVIRWDAPVPVAGNPVQEYLVRYGTTEIQVPGNQTQVQINGLTPETSYAISVVAGGANGLESEPLTRTYRTLNQVVLGVPEFEEPTDSDITETSLTVRWQPTGNATISGFRISLDGIDGQSFRVGESARSFTFTGLTAGTDYTVLLSALSPEGNESQAAVQSLVTREGPLPTATPTPTVSPTPTPTVSPTPVLTERRYTVKGTTTIKTLTKSAMPLTGTAALIVDDRSQPVQAALSLNDTQARSTAFGFLPITAAIGFATSGGVAISPDSTLTLAYKARIKVKSVKAFGAIPIAGGNNCQTKQLSTIPLSVAPGFTLAAGGTLGATYAVSDLNGCGILNGLVSPLVASTGNTMSLTLTSR